MRILLFGGFLGSGKTSVILQVARQITAIRKETVAIIENEIGEAGIDDQLLTGSGLQVRPLFGGCVCCQITSDLVTAVNDLAKTINPDWLVIEMTGLAVPGNVAKLIRQYDVNCPRQKTITIVDGGRWAELKEVLEPLVISQVKESDLVIINKADLIGPDIHQTVNDVRAIVGQTPVLTATATATLPPAVMEEVLRFG